MIIDWYYPSTQAYSIVARHARRLNLLFLAGQVCSYAGSYLGSLSNRNVQQPSSSTFLLAGSWFFRRGTTA